MIGPFNPPNKAEVPVWIACELKKRRKCRIVGPSWMSVGGFAFFLCVSDFCQSLRAVAIRLDACRVSRKSAKTGDNSTRILGSPSAIHGDIKIALGCVSHFSLSDDLSSTQSHMTPCSASDDIPSSDKVRSLLKDLREARQAKSHQGLEALNAHHIEMTGIGAYELNEVRPFFTLAMKRLVELSPDEEGGHPLLFRPSGAQRLTILLYQIPFI